MKALAGIVWVVLFCVGYATAARGEQPTPAARGLDSRRIEVRFTQSAPYSTATEVNHRLGTREPPPAYDLEKEKFEVIIPDTTTTNAVCGLFVWVSPSDSPRIPSDWMPQLARHKLLVAGAYNTGNNRNFIDRFRLALDAAFNMPKRFATDPKRVYIGGFSGGGRIASMLGVSYADVFTGTLAVCGVNFYTTLPAGRGLNYPPGYAVDYKMATLAKKQGRFVLLTGEKDPNRDNTKAVYERGFKWGGFARALYIEVPGMGHSVPATKDMEVALTFLDQEL